MVRGRNRKAGKRTKSGQLSRAGQPRFDKGSDKASDKFALYGTDGSDALGRAFVHGLLGEDGIVLRDTGRAVARAYWPMLGTGRISCTLGAKTGQGSEGNLEREQWLTATLRRIDSMGRDRRRAFDQLAIDINPDTGPDWLDRTIAKQPTSSDKDKMDMAIEVLKALAA
jgi:hypothetical protein